MAVTMAQVRAVLDPEETNYERAKALGPEALPHLETLIKTAEPMLASKAAYLAGLLAHSDSARVVAQAAASDEPTVRVAAAAAAKHLNDADVERVLTPLLADSDPGVRRMALGSVPESAEHSLRSRVAEVADSEPDEGVREKSRQVLQRMGGESRASAKAGGGSESGEMPKAGRGEGKKSKAKPASGEMPGSASAGGETPGPGSSGGDMPGMSDEGQMPGSSQGGRHDSGDMPGFTSGAGSGDMPGPRYRPGEMPL